jgi:glycosyltransferase involved in cell wall biosynthesis
MKKNLKVCMLTSSFPRFQGDSPGVFILSFCRELQKIGVETEIVAPHHYGSEYHEICGRIRVSRFPYFYPLKFQNLCYNSGILKNIKQRPVTVMQLPFFLMAEFCYTLWVAQKRKFDLVHAHWSIPQGFMGLILKKFSGIPFLTTLHGSDVYSLRSRALRRLNGMVINASNACTANSRATAEMARKVSGREDIRIIPMGVDAALFGETVAREDLRKRFRKDEKLIMYAGRLIDWKGVDYLVRALPEVLQKCPEAKLLIVGSGPCKSDLAGLSESLNLQKKIVFLDTVSQNELAQYYSLAHVFVLPSIMSGSGETEGLGLVLLEAMAAGIPVVGTNVGGIPDIIRDGETGLLALEKKPHDLSEKILRLLVDERLRERVKENGLRFVKENFSWKIVARKFKKVYEDILMPLG